MYAGTDDVLRYSSPFGSCENALAVSECCRSDCQQCRIFTQNVLSGLKIRNLTIRICWKVYATTTTATPRARAVPRARVKGERYNGPKELVFPIARSVRSAEKNKKKIVFYFVGLVHFSQCFIAWCRSRSYGLKLVPPSRNALPFSPHLVAFSSVR